MQEIENVLRELRIAVPKVRAAGIRAEIFPDASKMKKQMSYANAKNIPFVAIVGENEMNEGKVMLKNMETMDMVQQLSLVWTDFTINNIDLNFNFRRGYVVMICPFFLYFLYLCVIEQNF